MVDKFLLLLFDDCCVVVIVCEWFLKFDFFVVIVGRGFGEGFGEGRGCFKWR